MTDWLAGKTVRMFGDASAVASAVAAAGGSFVDDLPADILIHAVAATELPPAHLIDAATWRAALVAGLDDRFFQASAFAKACRESGRGGAVLFVGTPEQDAGSAQAAAAGALGNLTKTLGVEWARDGIRTNTILTRDTGPALGTLAAYLVSDYAAYVTGAVMGVIPSDG